MSTSAQPPTEPAKGYQVPAPFDSGHLEVGSLHKVFYEQSGNPEGNPVIFLHGGPGGGTSPSDRIYFDPKAYRIILMDQRGSGKSLPHACLEENTTWDLVSDIETLRKHLKIDKWVVFGGSWGSTLSLSYAITHPASVKALILRGIFLLRDSELKWFYQDGASHLFPDMWDGYLAPIPESERNDLMTAYYRRLTGDDEQERIKCAKAWSTWECATSRLYIDPVGVAKASQDEWSLAFARIECHYFVNKGFFKSDGWILNKENIDKIRHIPTYIAQGRYDVVCPARTAWDLKKAFPEAQLDIVPDAGHSAKEPGITAKLTEAADRFKNL
ncbi:proline iminopeptidase [Phlyctochytrium arcticum]|nr:proline iminopeptidase [Phlyctochytrium arcticum]